MNEVLRYLVEHCAFLWATARYRIVDSEVSATFGGNALLLVESEVLRLRFIRDRDQLFLDLQPTGGDRGDDWYSVRTVRRMFHSLPANRSTLDATDAEFLERNIGEIERQFSEAWPDVRVRLREIEKVRARGRFG